MKKLTAIIPNRKNTKRTNNSKLKIYGIDLNKELIAVLSPYDLEIILNGLETLATLKVLSIPKFLAYTESPKA